MMEAEEWDPAGGAEVLRRRCGGAELGSWVGMRGDSRWRRLLGGGLRAMGRASRGVIEEGSGAASRAREPERETFSESQTEEPLWILFSTSDVVAIRT